MKLIATILLIFVAGISMARQSANKSLKPMQDELSTATFGGE